MNDYKELLEELKRNGLSNGSALGHHSGLCDEAADAIKQLVKERDKLKLDLCEANDVIEYANDKLKETENERDALSEYISGLDCSNCGMRGVQ